MSSSGSAVVSEDRQRGGEVVAKAPRRRFTADYNLRVLRKANFCTEPREIGVLLMREGLYTSHLCHWRKTAACEGTHGTRPRQARSCGEGDEPAGAGDPVAESPCRAHRSAGGSPENVSAILGIELKRNGEKD